MFKWSLPCLGLVLPFHVSVLSGCDDTPDVIGNPSLAEEPGVSGGSEGASGTGEGPGDDGDTGSGSGGASGTTGDGSEEDGSGTTGDGDGEEPGDSHGEPVDSDGDPDSDGDSDGDGDGGRDDCGTAPLRYDLSRDRPNVMMVVDRSSSMLDAWSVTADAGEQTTRWSSVHDAVSDAVEHGDDSIDYGLQLFPSNDADPGGTLSCIVSPKPEVACSAESVAAIVEQLPPADTTALLGGAPAAPALESAMDHLRGLETEAPRAIVFVTDGTLGCTESPLDPWWPDGTVPEMLAIVEDAAADGIPTHVVGVGAEDASAGLLGTETGPHSVLAALGEAGGADPWFGEAFYDATNAEELERAMDQIMTRMRCTVALADDLPNGSAVEVGGQLVPPVSDCSQDGWRESHDDRTIELCGSACDALSQDPIVQIHLPCPADSDPDPDLTDDPID